jgi:hypothetical protein
MFTMFNAAAFRPWTPVDPAQVVLAWQRTGPNDRATGFTLTDVEFLRSHATSFSSLSGFRYENTRIRGTPAADLQYVAVGVVNHSFFDVLGARMALGRAFHPDEDRPGATRVTVISHVAWARHFAADP